MAVSQRSDVSLVTVLAFHGSDLQSPEEDAEEPVRPGDAVADVLTHILRKSVLR
ncbi:Protein of unknown function, partial [Gryllus bimaculatus]